MDPHSPVIRLDGLTKRYGQTLAVDELTFEVRPGHVTGFLGPNGAGKSTTMRLILGLDAPTAGTVTIGGVAYRRMRRPLYEVGATLEAAAVHPGRSARAHLTALARSCAIPRRCVDEVLGLVGLDAVAGRRVGTFSLGMTQRLGVAAALLGDPGVLLLDEPVNGLDPEGVAWIRGLLRMLAAEGRTVLVSSHLMAEMALTADQLIVLGRGRLVAHTSLQDFIRQAGGARHRALARPRPPGRTAAPRRRDRRGTRSRCPVGERRRPRHGRADGRSSLHRAPRTRRTAGQPRRGVHAPDRQRRDYRSQPIEPGTD
jgi:ABC-2 type transport system ATP-binding protein